MGLCIGALVFAGCGSDPGSSIADDAPPVEQPDSLASPLESQLGFSSEPGKRNLDLAEAQRQADATMVACMQQAGFFYAVAGVDVRGQSGAAVGDGSRLSAETNGIGITQSLIDALGADAAAAGAADADASNRAYIASLTADEAAAYDQALVGDGELEASGQFQPAGCWGMSYTQIVRTLAIIDEFDDQLTTLNERLAGDPRFLSFQKQWSTCMDAAGYRYDDEQVMADDLYARLLDIELIEAGDATQAASPAALDELLQFERAVATASYDCRQGFADEVQRLRIDYEQEFLDDNRFRLADLAEES